MIPTGIGRLPWNTATLDLNTPADAYSVPKRDISAKVIHSLMEIRVHQEHPVTWEEEQRDLSKSSNSNNEGNRLLNAVCKVLNYCFAPCY